METLNVDDRVVVKANTAFHGVVTRADEGGGGGYVHMDSDEEPTTETYFSAGELDPE